MNDESQPSLPLDVLPRTPQPGFTLSKQPVLPDCRKIEKNQRIWIERMVGRNDVLSKCQ